MKRRAWLLSATGAIGALIVGWGLLPQRSRTGSGRLWPPVEGEVALNGWIKILPDGSVVLAMPRSEMGQGVFTALSMLAAEELDVGLERIRLEQAGNDTIYGNVAMWVASPLSPAGAGRQADQGPGGRMGGWKSRAGTGHQRHWRIQQGGRCLAGAAYGRRYRAGLTAGRRVAAVALAGR